MGEGEMIPVPSSKKEGAVTGDEKNGFVSSQRMARNTPSFLSSDNNFEPSNLRIKRLYFRAAVHFFKRRSHADCEVYPKYPASCRMPDA